MPNTDIWIEVFKSGTHTDADGDTREWTTSDLDKIADLYNNQPAADRHEAPVVIGHPQDNSPAYGWVESLKRDGDVLLAKIKDLSSEFVNWVEKGIYKKRSISLYPNLLLRHIGFLGGVPPAVKGLADPVFAEEKDNKATEYEFEETAKLVIDNYSEIDRIVDVDLQQRISRYGIEAKEKGHIVKPKYYQELEEDDFADPVNWKLPLASKYIRATLANWGREQVKARYSAEEQKIIQERINKKNEKNNNYKEGENFMDEEKFNQLLADVVKFLADTFGEEVANQTSGFLTDNKEKYVTPTPTPAENANANANTNSNQSEEPQSYQDPKVRELQIEIENLKKENRRKDFQAYVNKLIEKDGKLLPKQSDIAMSLLELGANAGKLEFNENNKKKEIGGIELVKNFLESLETKVDIAPLKEGEVKPYKYTEFQNLVVDEERLGLDMKVHKYMNEQRKAGKTISYAEALNNMNNNIEE